MEGMFIGNATYFEGTQHFLVPFDFKEGTGSFEAVKKLYSLKKPTPIYDSPYLKRWQIVHEGRNMLEIPKFKSPKVFKIGSTQAIPVEPYKMEFYESVVDVKVAQSFSTSEPIDDPEALYFFINDEKFKTSESLPVPSEKDSLSLSKVDDPYLHNIEVLKQQEFEDEKGNFFGYVSYKGDTSPTSKVSRQQSHFYASIYGERTRFVLASNVTLEELYPTHLLVSEQPVFIAKMRVLSSDYILYRPIYFRDFTHYDCALDGFLHD